MADPHHADTAHDYQHGSQEISEQVSTFKLFMGMAKWGSLATALVILFPTLWFMPKGGFFLAAFVSVVVAVAGWFILKSKPAAH